VQAGFLVLGLALFLDQSKNLISDGQFTWGERRVMAIVAVCTLGGCALLGWLVGRLFKLFGDVVDLMADGVEASRRTNDMIEEQIVPMLGRIVTLLEESGGSSRSEESRQLPPSLDALEAQMRSAKAAGRAGKAIALRDAMTQFLKGEPLHSLDRELAIWLMKLVDQRVASQTVDAELAGWVAHAVDSLGEMPEAAPLRTSLPALRRHAGLCQKCGRPLASHDIYCDRCLASRHSRSSSPEKPTQPAPIRERQ
jgi:hypothetical protein